MQRCIHLIHQKPAIAAQNKIPPWRFPERVITHSYAAFRSARLGLPALSRRSMVGIPTNAVFVNAIIHRFRLAEYMEHLFGLPAEWSDIGSTWAGRVYALACSRFAPGLKRDILLW